MTMQSSYWETNRVLSTADLLIVGGGFTGLSAAHFAYIKNPSFRITVVEKHPYGQSMASTRNAGFACFGSPTEILADIEFEGIEQALARVKIRYEGIQLWLEMFSAKDFDYAPDGGLEVFHSTESSIYEKTLDKLSLLNSELEHHIGCKGVFSPSYGINDSLCYGIGIAGEAGLHPGKLHSSLLSSLQSKPIAFINGIGIPPLEYWIKKKGVWHIPTASGWIISEYILLANNAGLSELTKNTVPGRGQVILTEPFNHGLPAGTFHAREGYMYFRTLGDRILLGGGRDAFRKQEESMKPIGTKEVKLYLEDYLTTHICPGQQVSIAEHWAGIMAFTNNQQKGLLSKYLEDKVLTAGRMGGMGVAIAPRAAQDAVHQLLS
ncbi:MAG TPA: hypothetical protein DCF84_08545 [Bacteroidetes bacterium]|nr:hypothetical protein [Bacteroidota bacterium]